MHRKRNGRSKRGGHAAPYGRCRLSSEFLLAAKVIRITLCPNLMQAHKAARAAAGRAERPDYVLWDARGGGAGGGDGAARQRPVEGGAGIGLAPGRDVAVSGEARRSERRIGPA